MKVIRHKPTDDYLERSNRKLQAELLRELRLENTQRSVLCYGWFSISAIGIALVFFLVLLMGFGVITLPDKVILALIGATVANGSAMFLTIIRSLFSKRE